MSAFLLQVFTLLTTEAGSLTYHLVLAFAIAGAIPGAIHQSRVPGLHQAGRMIMGLGGVLIFQLLLFASTGLIWQGLFNPGDLLPLIDRAVILMSVVLVIWLWAFPEPSRRGDAAISFLALVTIACIILAGVWWFDQPISTPFAGSWVDKGSDYLALSLIGLGLLILLARRNPGWGLGLAMLVGLAIGHLGNLFILTPSSDYSGAIRLAQMASYPLLLALPARYLWSIKGIGDSTHPGSPEQPDHYPRPAEHPTRYQNLASIVTSQRGWQPGIDQPDTGKGSCPHPGCRCVFVGYPTRRNGEYECAGRL